MNSFAADAGTTTVKTVGARGGQLLVLRPLCDPDHRRQRGHRLRLVQRGDLDPEVNAAAAEFLVGAVTVADAVQHLDEATASLYPYAEIDSLLERAPFYNNPPVESDEYVTYQQWIDQWQEIKGSA